MPAAKYTQIGEIYGQWRVIEANIINPNSNNKTYKNKPSYSRCICTVCNSTELLILNNDLRGKITKNNSCCKKCAIHKKAEQNRKIKIGDKFGLLTVIGDGGYTNKRHYSICQCDCGRQVIYKDNALLTGNCKSCGCQTSRGEAAIIKILQENNIKFEHDVVYPQLFEETGHRYRFDFIIYNSNGTINRFLEYDGRQRRYGPDTNYWGHTTDSLETIPQKDNIKNRFCISHGYKIARIPYTKLEQIDLKMIFDDKYLIKEI